MLAIDTNLIVRYLTGDHPTESLRARQLIDGEAVFVCTTVLLETEWVLRGAYGFAAARIVNVLRAFGGLPRVTLEDPAQAAQALDWTEQGMDFADALHLVKASGCTAFISFDRRLARMAGKVAGVAVRVP